MAIVPQLHRMRNELARYRFIPDMMATINCERERSKLICPSRTVPVHIENCYTGNRRTNLWFSKCRPKSESDARDKRGMDTLRKPLPIPRFAVCLFFFSPLPGLVARSDGAAVIKLLNETEVILSVRRSLFFDAFLVESC